MDVEIRGSSIDFPMRPLFCNVLHLIEPGSPAARASSGLPSQESRACVLTSANEQPGNIEETFGEYLVLAYWVPVQASSLKPIGYACGSAAGDEASRSAPEIPTVLDSSHLCKEILWVLA